MSTVTLPNALLLKSWEIWSLLLCAYPLSVFTHPYLHQSWKAKSRRTEPRFDDCKSSLELTGEAQWSVANQGTQEHEDPTLEETRGPAQFLSLTEGVSFMRMNIWSSFLFRNRTFSQHFFLFYNSWRMLPICHPMPKKAKQCFPSICRTSDGVQWDNLPAQINRHHTFQDWSLQKSSCSTTTEIYEDWEGIRTALLLLF